MTTVKSSAKTVMVTMIVITRTEVMEKREVKGIVVSLAVQKVPRLLGPPSSPVRDETSKLVKDHP